ncbi:MAG: hypothetical protein ACOX2K_06510 [Bacillota bacterium]|jgi:hypothetical protein
MFKWWNETILPNSKVKWSYPVLFSVFWLTLKYYLQRTFVPAAAALDVLAIIFANIALAAVQAMTAKPATAPPEKTEVERAMERKKRQRKQRNK